MVWERRRDEDEVDRVNRLWTVLILGIAGVSALLYVAVFPDDAISCIPSKSGVVGSVPHANRYCLAQNRIRENEATSNSWGGYSVISYHPIVPTFLFIHLLAFLFPHVLAQFLAGMFGNDAEFLVKCAEKAKSNKDLDGTFLQSIIKSPPNPSQKLAVVYLLKKSLILLNSIIQLGAVGIISSADMVEVTGREFPLFTYCEVHKVEYYCSLHVNDIYHKFYLCLFYWLLALSVMNLGSLIGWVLKLFLPRLTSKTINTYTMTGSTENPEKTQRFLNKILGRDYLLSLLMSESTEREITAGDLTLKLWQSYEPGPAPNGDASDENVNLSQL